MGRGDVVARRAVGRHLRRLRETLGWTLGKAAGKASNESDALTPSTLSRVERGETPVAVDTLSRLCRCLGTDLSSVDEIIRDASERSRIECADTGYEDLMAEGNSLGSRGDVSRALAHFEAAQDWVLLQESVDHRDRLLAKAMLLQAECLKRMRRFSHSLELAGRVLNLTELGLDHRIRALVLRVQVAYWKGDFYEAELFGQALERDLEEAAPLTRALGIAALGNLAFEREQWAEATQWLARARTLYAEHLVSMERSRSGVMLGYCRHRLGDSGGGKSDLSLAIEEADRQGHGVVVAYGLRMRARLELDQGETEGALADYDAAAEWSRKLEMPDERFIALFGAWTIHGRTGDQVEAARLDSALRRMLLRVSDGLPEARVFQGAVHGNEGKSVGRNP